MHFNMAHISSLVFRTQFKEYFERDYKNEVSVNSSHFLSIAVLKIRADLSIVSQPSEEIEASGMSKLSSSTRTSDSYLDMVTDGLERFVV